MGDRREPLCFYGTMEVLTARDYCMKKRLFSGVQPSGNLHLGNYLGAIKQWAELQDEYEAIVCVVDLHAITVPQNPEELRKKTLETVKIYLASGIDPSKTVLFVQSHVKEHSELAWILNTITKNGDLMKMTQLKDKAGFDDIEEFERVFLEALSKPERENIIEALRKMSSLEAKKSADTAMFKTTIEFLKRVYIHPINETGVGLFDYPVLMAADIVLYDAAVVPVGEDQVQHVELTRTLARRFNDRFGETFIVPTSIVRKESSRIMALDDPTKKMSKSAASEYNYIALTDDADTIRKKIKKAVTDSGSEIVYSDDKPALQNLINIYMLLSGKSAQDIQAMYVGKGYGDFKADLAEVVVNFLVPFQERLASISDDEAMTILRAGAEKAHAIAEVKMLEVKKKVGFVI